MQEILFSFFLIGSVSVGYSLVRIAFPKVQLKKTPAKIIYGYIFGLIIFGIPLVSVYFLGIDSLYFLGLSLIIYALVFIIMYSKRILFKEIEIIQKTDKIRKAEIPLSILKQDEIEKKILFEKGLMVKSSSVKILKPGDIKKQVFSEKNNKIIQSINKETKKMELNETEAQKRTVLEKLRAAAMEISKKKTGETSKEKENEPGG